MKPDAILVNVARGAVIDEDALYRHLEGHASFSAAIDAWWDEPRGGARFSPRLAWMELPNVLGSPHNSAVTETSLVSSARAAAENIVRALTGERVEHLVDRSEY